MGFGRVIRAGCRLLALQQVTRETVRVQPATRYARSGDVSIAYQVVGEGPVDLVWVPHVAHHVELNWENPMVERFLRRLASIARVLVFDKRGTGMSDRLAGTETLEERMDDIRAVMAAVGSEQAVISGLGDAGPLSVLFAATYPERTSGLVLIHTWPRLVRSPALPWLPTRAERERQNEEMVRRTFGDVDSFAEGFRRSSPSAAEDEVKAFARVVRFSVSPGAMAAYMQANLDVDVCNVLPLLQVPTLVLQRTQVEAGTPGALPVRDRWTSATAAT